MRVSVSNDDPEHSSWLECVGLTYRTRKGTLARSSMLRSYPTVSILEKAELVYTRRRAQLSLPEVVHGLSESVGIFTRALFNPNLWHQPGRLFQRLRGSNRATADELSYEAKD